MTTKEHAYAIKRLFSPTLSDDSRLTLSFVVALMKVARATLIEQKFKKYEPVAITAYQSVKVTLQKDAQCLPFPCLLKSTTKIPAVLETKRSYPLKVYDQEMREIPYSPIHRAGFKKYSQFKSPFYFVLDGYLYISGNDYLTEVTITGLFEELVNTCNNTPQEFCDPYDTEFPIEADLTQAMYDIVLDRLRFTLRVPNDNVNDAQPNTYPKAIY